MPKPAWLKVQIASGNETKRISSALHGSGLHTVCEEANCPNQEECWSSGTATFLVLGKVCTRNCLFCGVESARQGEALDGEEARKIAEAVKRFCLRYAVLTSVDRDDLPDFGALHFAECIRAVKEAGARVEALIPDFQGRKECLREIVGAKPDVIGHNIEVVERLQGIARDARAGYKQSLGVLGKLKELDALGKARELDGQGGEKALGGRVLTKSSIMLGIGEGKEEVLQAMDDLRHVGVDFLTLGQYLQPTKRSLPVVEFVRPEVFEEYRKAALAKGFLGVYSGPLVRSSYKAGELFEGEKGA